MPESSFEKALALMDAANNEDPNIEMADGKEWPKEQLYAVRMSDMLERYKPEADDVTKLAIRGQHIQRWKSPRSDYPMNRKGYHLWRSQLYKFHAERVAEIMQQAGYDDAALERVKIAVGKKALKSSPDTQLLEDVAALVFIEHYMLAFAEKHPEYDEAKWIEIIRRTWNKMTDDAHAFALAGNITLPEPLVPLIQKSISD